jgi:hypothetical protein
MLYLPGIDGTGLAAYKQFPRLVEDYDLRALFIPAADRTPFPELLELCECALRPKALAISPTPCRGTVPEMLELCVYPLCLDYVRCLACLEQGFRV